jgi:O-antigen ligase
VILPVALMFYQLRKVRLWLYATVTVAAIVLVVAQLKPQSFTQVQTSLAKLTRTTDLDVSEGSMTLRVKQWRTAIEQFQQHPVLGAGLGSWRSIWSKTPYLPLDSSNRSLNNPHNDYLLNAAETGLLGLLSIVAILAWFAWRSWRMNSLWGAAAFCLTCAVAVTAAVNAPFRDGGFGMSLMWLMAAATAASYSSVVARSSA